MEWFYHSLFVLIQWWTFCWCGATRRKPAYNVPTDGENPQASAQQCWKLAQVSQTPTEVDKSTHQAWKHTDVGKSCPTTIKHDPIRPFISQQYQNIPEF